MRRLLLSVLVVGLAFPARGQCPAQVSCSFTDPAMQKASSVEIQSAIQAAGSASAAARMVEAQIADEEAWIREAQRTGDLGGAKAKAIALMREKIQCDRTVLTALQCHARTSGGAGTVHYSDEAREGIQQNVAEIRRRQAELATRVFDEAEDPTAALPLSDEERQELRRQRRENWIAENAHQRQYLEEQLERALALLREDPAAVNRDMDDLFSEIQKPAEPRSGAAHPPDGVKDPTKPDAGTQTPGTCEVAVSGVAGALPIDLGNNPVAKSWSFQFPVEVKGGCGALAEITLRVSYKDGSTAREILQRPFVGTAFDTGLMKVDLPVAGVARITRVVTESLRCRCDGELVDASQPRQVIYGEADLAAAQAQADKAAEQAREEQEREEAARCPSVKALKPEERRELCANKNEVWQNVQAAWHRTSMQALAYSELSASLQEIEDDLVRTYEADYDTARRRVDVANALNKIEKALSLMEPLADGKGVGEALVQCSPPLKLETGLSAKDVKNQLKDIRAILDFASDPSVTAYLKAFGSCFVREWSPLLGKVQTALKLIGPEKNDEKFEEGMADYRSEVLLQIEKLRRSSAEAKRRHDELNQQMSSLTALMNEVTYCACE